MKPAFIIISSVLLCFILCNCKKSSNTNYTQNIGGTRNWHRYYYVEARYPGSSNSDTTYNYSDTSFAVTVINTNTINIMNNTFSFERSDSSNRVYYFGTAWEYYEHGNGTGLVYYSNKDSIVYVDGTFGHDGTTDYVCYTY